MTMRVNLEKTDMEGERERGKKKEKEKFFLKDKKGKK